MYLYDKLMDYYELPGSTFEDACLDSIFEHPQDDIHINCSNISGYEFYDSDEIQVPLEKQLIPAVFGVIFFVGTIGNALVVYVIYRVGTMKTVTNIYLGNLAAADLLFLLICVTFTVFQYLMYWPFGEVMCKLVTYFMVVTMAVSVFTLTAIAIDRYLVVVHPISSRNSRTILRTSIILIIIWLVCAVGLCPIMIISKVVVIWEHGSFHNMCFETWRTPWDRRIYTLCIFAFVYIIPFFIMALCYWQIRKNLLTRVRPGNSSSREAILKATRINKKVVKLVLVVTFVFAFCWLPTHIAYITADFFCPNADSQSMRALHVFKLISNCMSYANSALNPVIYCFMSTNFRRYFKLAFTCAKNTYIRSRTNGHIEDVDRTPSEKCELQSFPVTTSYVGHVRGPDSPEMTLKSWPNYNGSKLLVPRQATYDATLDMSFV